MARRLFSMLLLASLGWGCASTMNAPDPYWSSDPSANQMNTQRQGSIPYCPGGDRAKHCLLGKVCRATEQGCQVCQCESLDD